jgi:hypothetical protein
MADELNNLAYNNTNITFINNINNIATSDELDATPIYQDKMGTAYSKSKHIARAFNIAGISLIMTAAAIKTGSIISNAYVLNPPSVSAHTYALKDHVFNASFTISNPGNYKIDYYLFINDNKEAVISGDCSEEKEYTFEYQDLKKNDRGHFYIEFTNKVDYKKTIETYKFVVED